MDRSKGAAHVRENGNEKEVRKMVVSDKNPNTLVNKSQEKMEVAIMAPGANRDNTDVVVENRGEDDRFLSVRVTEADLPEVFQGKIDVSIDHGFQIDPKFDATKVKVGIKDGIIFVKIPVRDEVFTKVEIDEE